MQKLILAVFFSFSISQTFPKIEKEIPPKLLCGFNAFFVKIVNDTTIQYRVEIFRGWHSKYEMRNGKAIKYYPKVIDSLNLDWISYRSIGKKDTMIFNFGYDSLGKFQTGRFSIRNKKILIECNKLWKK